MKIKIEGQTTNELNRPVSRDGKHQPAAKGPARTRHRRAKRSSRAVAFNSTPSSYHQKISSTLGTDKCPKQFTRPVLDAVLARELQNSQFTMVPQLVEHSFLKKPFQLRSEKSSPRF